MDPKLKKNIRQAIQKDHNRNREHQTNCMLRLTKEQAAYLTDLRERFGVGRGTYLRRLLIIDMEKRKHRQQAATINEV
jgi:hypothetical protein